MRRRISVAVTASLAVHVAAAALIVGSSLWRGWPAGPVDVEITGMRLEDLQDVPLGGPASGTVPADVIAPPPAGAVPPSPDSPERDPAQAKPKSRPKREPRAQAAPTDADGGVAAPRPTSVRSYGPEGSRVTALLRVDRLRGTVYAPAVDALLLNLPDRQDLLEGTDIDLYRDIDAILIATPNPLDARVTFLAARHRLTDGAMRAALDRGARATNRKLTWRTERGRPFAERRAAAGPAAPAAPATDGVAGDVAPPANRANRDQRLILLPASHLVVVTPPAYRRLLLNGGRAPAASRDGGAPGATDAFASVTDGGAPSAAADPDGWATLVRRIDAEDSILPPDAVAMVSAVDLFTGRSVRSAFNVAPGTRGSVDDEPGEGGRKASVGTGTILGLPLPGIVTATLGVTPQPFADIDAEFSHVADAAQWEDEWPALRQKLRANPLIVLSGFSGLFGRVTLTRTAAAVRVHVDATELETTRILQLIAARISALRRP